MGSQLSKKDQVQLDAVKNAAEVLMTELSKLISADNGMLGIAAAAATETARGLHSAAKLWDVVTNTDEEG